MHTHADIFFIKSTASFSFVSVILRIHHLLQPLARLRLDRILVLIQRRTNLHKALLQQVHTRAIVNLPVKHDRYQLL